jgi:hypothetical protein
VNFAETTTACFGNMPPVGHILRSALSDRWLRVHSLPDSKRYAETEFEYEELLRRHNEIALEILGPDSEAILFLHAWGTALDFSAAFSSFDWATRLELNKAIPTVYPSSDVDDSNVMVIACLIRWSPHAWDSLLRDVADDRLPSIVLLNPASGEAYAPYDGGADLFLADSERIATLATRWSLWLSKHPAGL